MTYNGRGLDPARRPRKIFVKRGTEKSTYKINQKLFILSEQQKTALTSQHAKRFVASQLTNYIIVIFSINKNNNNSNNNKITISINAQRVNRNGATSVTNIKTTCNKMECGQTGIKINNSECRKYVALLMLYHMTHLDLSLIHI